MIFTSGRQSVAFAAHPESRGRSAPGATTDGVNRCRIPPPVGGMKFPEAVRAGFAGTAGRTGGCRRTTRTTGAT